MFNKKVKILLKYNNDSYVGTSYVLFKYSKKYFMLEKSYGSCCVCDNWIDSDLDVKQVIVNMLFYGIKVFKHLRDIKVSLYCDPDWTSKVKKYMKHKGISDNILKKCC